MTTILGKLGTQAENVYHAASYITPIAWTQSFYSAVTDHVVLPTTKWIWTKLEQQSSVVEQPEELSKPSRRCAKGADCLVKPVIFIFRKTKDFLRPESLYEVCKYVKGATYPWIRSEPVKIPDLEQYNRFGRVVGYTLEGADKVTIQASRTLYVIADVGEKTIAVRLFVGEMAPQLRPSLKEHFVEPVFADVKRLIAGPKKDPATFSELMTSGARSIGGDIVEREGVAFVDQYLAGKEAQITRTVMKMEDDARTQAVSWFSNAVIREGVNSFVTPVVVSGLLSVPGYVVEVVSIVTLSQNASGYLETARTAAYVISYLKYANRLMWAINAGKTIYKLHQSYTSEFTGEAMKLLRKSLTRRSDTAPENDIDPTKEIKEYSVVVAKQCDLPGLLQQMTDKTGLSGLIDSAPLQTLQRHAENFTHDIKVKSEAALIKYDLIDSPTVEEVSDDDSSDEFFDCEEDFFYDCEDTFSPASNKPTSSVVTKDDAVSAVVSLLGFDPSKPADPSEPVVSAPGSKEQAVSKAVNFGVRAGLDLLEKVVASSSAPTTSPDSTPIEGAATDSKKADDTKETPPTKLSWARRIAATVSRVAGAILTFLRKLPPSFLSKFSGIFPGNSSGKSNAATLFRYFFPAK